MTGIFITARLGSTRLTQKHLIQVEGKPFIEWLVERFYTEFKKEISANQIKIFLTTSTKPENKQFEGIFEESLVEIFYGSDDNIPFRHLQCAEANDIEYIVSVDGDDIVCSTRAARIVYEKLTEGSDIVQTAGLPLGMNITGYSLNFLKRSLENKTLMKLETGWGKIFDSKSIDVVQLKGFETGQHLRMTLDYPEDADFFKSIISNLSERVLNISDEELINLVIDSKWSQLNEGLSDQYWASFNKKKQEED